MGTNYMAIDWNREISDNDKQLAWTTSIFRYTENQNINPNKKMTGFIGAIGEIYVARVTRIKPENLMIPYDQWMTKRFTHPDVGIFEIKTTSNSHGQLCLTDSDKDGAIAILVIAENSKIVARSLLTGNKTNAMITVRAIGWTDVSDAKKGLKNIGYGGKAEYRVRPEELRPMADLDGIIEDLQSKPGIHSINGLPPFIVE